MNLSEIARRIAVQESPSGIVQAAVDGAYDVLGTDTTFAATASPNESAYRMASTRGHFGRRFHQIVIPPMIGVGGRVAITRQPMAVHDYLTERSITRHFVDIIVGEEGLRGIACVPVVSSGGVEALLYAGLRSPGFLEGRSLEALEEIATYAAVAIEQTLKHARQEELALLRERQRLATTLHDSVAQALFAIGVEAKRSRAQTDPARLAGGLEEIEALASHAGRELRETLHRINDIPESLALDALIDAEARLFEHATNRAVRVIRRGTTRGLLEEQERLVIDTVREGLRNALKHTAARLIVVHLLYVTNEVRLAVQTDGGFERCVGRGLSPDDRGQETSGGLALLRKRAEVLRGRLELELGDEGETILRLALPHGGDLLL